VFWSSVRLSLCVSACHTRDPAKAICQERSCDGDLNLVTFKDAGKSRFQGSEPLVVICIAGYLLTNIGAEPTK